jgi:tight adherence protein B
MDRHPAAEQRSGTPGMRPLAAAAAAVAAWIATGGAVPALARRRVTIRPTALAGVAAAALGTFVITLGLSSTPIVAGALAVLGAGIPPAVSASRRRRRSESSTQQWPDLLSALRRDLAAGSSVPEATISAGRRLGGEMAGLADRVAADLASGSTFPEAAAALRQEWADPVADRVLTTLAAAAVTGGDHVSAILGALAASVSDELRLRRAHDAALTQQRLTSAVALIAPWGLLILTTATNPQAAQALSSGAGPLIVAAGLLATGIGYLLARRAARLSRPPRLFS